MSDIYMTMKSNKIRRLRTAGKKCEGDIYITTTGGTVKTSMEDGYLVTSFTRVIDGVETTTATFRSLANGAFSVPYGLLCGDIDNLREISTLDTSSWVSFSLPFVTVGTNTYAFENCPTLVSATFPTLGGDGMVFDCSLRGCSSLTTVDLGEKISWMNGGKFDGTGLTTLILRNRGSAVSASSNQIASALGDCPIVHGRGYVYVPRALVGAHKGKFGWEMISNQFRALEDYTVDGTTTGELDITKI